MYNASDECCPFWNIFYPCLPLPLALSTFPRPPTPSPSPPPFIYLCLSLPNISLSPSLAPCPVTSYPRCKGDRVISVMSSKGKCETAAGGDMGDGYRMVLLAILGIAMACCDTWKQPILHLRFIFFTVRCQWRHSAWAPLYPNTRHAAHLTWWSRKNNPVYLQKSIPVHCTQQATAWMENRRDHRNW